MQKVRLRISFSMRKALLNELSSYLRRRKGKGGKEEKGGKGVCVCRISEKGRGEE